MSKMSLREMQERLKLVDEPGLADPVAIREARLSQTTTLLSGEKNSYINAKRAYAKMVGGNVQPSESVPKESAKILTESENLKIVGAMQVIKELMEGTKINKVTAPEVFKKVKGIMDSF